MVCGDRISPVGVNFGKTRTGTVFLEMDANGKIDLSPVGVNFGKTRAGTVFLEMDAKQAPANSFSIVPRQACWKGSPRSAGRDCDQMASTLSF